jgi:hypothetical protein
MQARENGIDVVHGQWERRAQGIRTHGSINESVEMEHGQAIEAPANERVGHRSASPKPPHHLSTTTTFGRTCRCSTVKPRLTDDNPDGSGDRD